VDGHVQHDGFGRDINYLRIAVTDKCNFRCIYCMPAEGVAPRAHDELLSAEEIARFVRLVAGEGIRRVRLTGGEPLVSRRIIPLIRDIRAIPQIEDISLTTNGALLPKLAPQLKDAGLNRVNISLDTLDPTLFGKITRLGRLEQTMAGIDAALAWGFEPVKVNCVVVRRLNQDVAALARLTLDRPIHLRFIEYMPSATNTRARIALWIRMRPRSIRRCGMRATPCRATSYGRASMPGPPRWAWASSSRSTSPTLLPARVPRAIGAFRVRRERSALSAPCPTILRELQPPAPDGRRQRASVPVRRCRVFGA
jgi:molybdenum cofactor biosynthesis enzyme MoaA